MAGGSSATTQRGRPYPMPKRRSKKAASKTRKSFPLKSPQKFIKGVFEIGQVPASEPLMAAHEKRIFHYPLRRRMAKRGSFLSWARPKAEPISSGKKL